MTDSRETFVTYPYNPDAPASAETPQDPPPAALQPRVAPPPQVSPPPVDESEGMGRRMLIGIAGAVGVAIVAGGFFSAASRNGLPQDPWPADPEASTAPAAPTDDGAVEPSFASLDLGDHGSIGLEVPVGWQVDSQDDYLVISHDSGRLVARIPEWNRASRKDLAREADYLRDGFDPTGDPIVFDNSTSRLTQFNQVTAGRFAGEPATEEVMLLLYPEIEQAIAIWWATVDADKQAGLEARTMVADLRAAFLEL